MNITQSEKDELVGRTVRISFGPNEYNGIISGRLEKFAGVTFGTGNKVYFSWEAIKRAIVNDSVLRAS